MVAVGGVAVGGVGMRETHPCGDVDVEECDANEDYGVVDAALVVVNGVEEADAVVMVVLVGVVP